MTRATKSLLQIGGLSVVIPVLLASMTPIHAQSGAASLLESNPTPPTKSTPSQTTEDEAQKQATVAQLVKQGNDAYVNADYEDAIAAYSQAIDLYQQNAYAYYNRGNAHRKLKNAKAAFQDYTLAIRLNPENSYAYFYRGILLAEAEDYQNALQDLSTALKLTDQNPTIFEKRGEIHEKLDDEDAAKDDYDKARKIYQRQGNERKAELLRRKIGRPGR